MKNRLQFLLTVFLVLAAGSAGAYDAPTFPYSPGAGEAGSTALWSEDPAIAGWASGIQVEYGEEVAEEWKTEEAALGPASLNDHDVVVLGRGGVATLEFSPHIRDGTGFDFAVFENSFSGTFLELAYVEVSSDGEHFVRFPNYSQTASPVPGFGEVQPEWIHGYAGKHAGGYGTPFDLSELAAAHAALLQGYDGFSESFAATLLDNFPHLDLQAIRYVRIIDIPGDGSALDCQGYPVYDPYPTIITAGFDLDAVAVLNQVNVPVVSFADWSAARGLPANAGADTDGDGWPQYMEYQFGSEPAEASSVPSLVQSLTPSGTHSVLYWRSLSAGSVLRIQYSLDGESWSEAGLAGSVTTLEKRVTESAAMVLEKVDLPYTGGMLLLRFAAEASPGN